MPTSITCLFNDQEIGIKEALELKERVKSPLFLCVNCGEKINPYSGGGHTSAHFQHNARNPECPLSHSDLYHYGGISSSSWQNPDTNYAIEGYATERKYLAHHRNAAVVLECKERDNNTCRACGFSLRVNGRSIIECHHLVPLASEGGRITSVDDLTCLCPTCHRIAHTSNPPLALKNITNLIKGSNHRLQRTA